MSDKEKYLKLVELCDEHFGNTIIQTYTGSSTECKYCGAFGSRKHDVTHESDCPISKYKEIMDV